MPQIIREGMHIMVMMNAHFPLIREVSRIFGPLTKVRRR